MSIDDETIIREATFNPKVKTYWLLSGALVLTFTIIGIPLLPFWFFFGNAVTERYLQRLRCVLTDRSLYVRSGMFVRVEKTVPLDKITDLGVVQGPIMRYLEIESLNVETAGQAMTSAIAMLGIVDNQSFRDAVLKQRDEFVGEQRRETTGPATGATSPPSASTDAVLVEIRDTLVRIEQQLKASKSG